MTSLDQKSEAQANLIDFDELAREKVQTIENLLESSENYKLETIESWMSTLKQIITAADLHRTSESNKNDINSPEHLQDKSNLANNHQLDENGESIYADYADDNEQFNAVDLTEQFASNSVKWTIRVKAFKLAYRLINLLFNHKSLNQQPKSSVTILKQLPDLVRLSFVAATSPYDDLKIQGFQMFKYLIEKFASVEEKEFPGHSILEQYSSQLLSALKPAFDLDAPPYITAIASQVCCSWLCKGLEKDPVNMQKTFQLMMTTIDKLESQSVNQNSKLYTESELEQERLDILSSWAQLYIATSDKQQKSQTIRCLDELVKSNIDCLISKWWEALRDYALLIMPTSKANISPTSHVDNGHVYTRDVALRLFSSTWPQLILAATIWLCRPEPEPKQSESNKNVITDCQTTDESKDVDKKEEICDISDTREKYCKFICGIIMKELCEFAGETNQVTIVNLPQSILYAMRSLYILSCDESFKQILFNENILAQEFYTILYRILSINIKLKSSHITLIRAILDIIFGSFLNKFADDEKNITYCLAKLTTSIDYNLARSKNDYLAKLNLMIKINSLLSVIKSQPSKSFIQNDIEQAVIEIFQKILSFQEDLSVSTSLLDPIYELYKLMPQETTTKLSRALFKSKIIVAVNFLAPTNSDKNRLALLEKYLKHFQFDIEFANSSEIRRELISLLMSEFLQPISNFREDYKKSSSLKIVLEKVINCFSDIEASFKDNFDDVLKSDVNCKFLFDSALKLRESIKVADESANSISSQSQAKKLQSTAKQPAKILLKADFSNFYAKRP